MTNIPEEFSEMPPGRQSPGSIGRFRPSGNQAVVLDPNPSPISIYPPGMIAPQSLLRSRLDLARSRDNLNHTAWYITPAGSDSNGGTSLVVRSTGTDAHTNSSSGLDRTTSISADGVWSNADVGHGIKVGSFWRLITSFEPPKTLGSVTTTSATNTCTSAGLFSPSMVGQRFVGPGVPSSSDRTVATFVDASNITLSGTTPTGSSGSATLSSMFRTSGATLFNSNTTGQNWTVGGPWASLQGTTFSSSSPVVGGDTVYCAPGVYLQQNFTDVSPSRSSPVNIVGDVSGSTTGYTGGEVRFTTFAYEMEQTNWPWYIRPGLSMGYAFSNIVWQTNGNVFNVGTWRNASFTNCASLINGNGSFFQCSSMTPDVPLNLTIDRCTLYESGSSAQITITTAASALADFNINALVQNCEFIGPISGIQMAGTAGTFHGGGMVIRNNTFHTFNSTAITTTGAVLSTNFPMYVYENSFLSVAAPLSAATVGQMIEDYNVFNGSSAFTGTPVSGGHSIGRSGGAFRAPNFSVGQERVWGGLPRYAFSPVYDEDINLGLGGMPDGISPIPSASLVDISGRQRTSTGRYITSGTFTSATANNATDTTANFNMNLAGATVRITGGTGAGQTKIIGTRTATAISIFNVWAITPDATSTYVIYWGTHVDGGKVTGANANSVTYQAGATWNSGEFIGYTLEITGGTGVGQTRLITAITTAITVTPNFTTIPDATSTYSVYRGISASTQNRSAGAWEHHDLADKETVTTDAGGVAIRLAGESQHRFRIPVNAAVTNISVKARFDSNHGSTSRPQACIVANPEVGVVAQVVTMQAAADTWETLAFTAFTPTSAGWIEVELQSHAAVPYGRAYFDTFSVA